MSKNPIYTRARSHWENVCGGRHADGMTFLILIDIALNPVVFCPSWMPQLHPALGSAEILPWTRFERLCEAAAPMEPIPLSDIVKSAKWVSEICRRCGWTSVVDFSCEVYNYRLMVRADKVRSFPAEAYMLLRSRLTTGGRQVPKSAIWQNAFPPAGQNFSFAQQRVVAFYEAFSMRAAYPFSVQFGFTEDVLEGMAHIDSDPAILHPGLVVYRDGYRIFSWDAIRMVIHRMALDVLRHLLYTDAVPPSLDSLRHPIGDDILPDHLLIAGINQHLGFNVYRAE
jgi:hypothetical protein